MTSVVGQRARQFCPVTCGCSSPSSNLLLVAPEFGCGGCAETLSYQQSEKQGTPCRNAPLDEAQKWAEQLGAAALDWPGSAGTTAIGLVNIMEKDGCDAAELSTFSEYCLDAGPAGLPVKPLTRLCPISCGCKITDLHPTCPSRCF